MGAGSGSVRCWWLWQEMPRRSLNGSRPTLPTRRRVADSMNPLRRLEKVRINILQPCQQRHALEWVPRELIDRILDLREEQKVLRTEFEDGRRYTLGEVGIDLSDGGRCVCRRVIHSCFPQSLGPDQPYNPNPKLLEAGRSESKRASAGAGGSPQPKRLSGSRLATRAGRTRPYSMKAGIAAGSAPEHAQWASRSLTGRPRRPLRLRVVRNGR